MTWGAVVLAMLAAAPASPGPGRRSTGERPPQHRTADLSVLAVRDLSRVQGAWRSGAAPRAPEVDRSGTPACAGEVCQPRVSIPGQQAALRGSRSEAALAFFARCPFEPVSRAARFVVERNLRVDYYPASGPIPDRGWGRLVLSLRWRLGAAD